MCLWKTPKISSVSTTARDILPSTTSEDPQSPVYGGENDWKNKNRGVAALKISKTNSSSNNSNSNSFNTTEGGWSI